MQDDFSLEAYNYHLPEDNIAQHPTDRRDHSRLLLLHRSQEKLEDKVFKDIVHLIPPGDILVVNNTKVFPARLLGKKSTGGKAEVFLLELPTLSDQKTETDWQIATAIALIKSSKRPRPGSILTINEKLTCTVLANFEGGKSKIEMHCAPDYNLMEILAECGQIPLPPYIERSKGSTQEDKYRYQTVYADQPGAVAAPTAGLHFTDSLLQQLKTRGVHLAQLTLHVGYGTFAPVRAEKIREHAIHSEHINISHETAEHINTVRENGGKVWAVGTTTVRALEASAGSDGKLQTSNGWCDLYIVPGYHFKIVDNLITNFHLPKSSLLFLVSALCGREKLLSCYRQAITKGYRFYSYGDAMAIIE